MTDKSFGDHTNKNNVKNPLLSSAVTGLCIEDLTHNAVLLPVVPGNLLISSQDTLTSARNAATVESTGACDLNMQSGDTNANIFTNNTLPPPPSDFQKRTAHKPNDGAKNPEKSDDFDVDEYFARLQSTRYVSAPLNLPKEDANANLGENEENLEEISLNDTPPDPSEATQSFSADIAQNISQLPQVLPHVASAVFSSFSNMLSLRSREQTPDFPVKKPLESGYQEVDVQSPYIGSNVGLSVQTTVSNVGVSSTVPPKEPPRIPNTGTSNTFRMTNKKKIYAQIPGLSSRDTGATTYQQFNPTAPQLSTVFDKTQQTNVEQNVPKEQPFPIIHQFSSQNFNPETPSLLNPVSQHNSIDFNVNAADLANTSTRDGTKQDVAVVFDNPSVINAPFDNCKKNVFDVASNINLSSEDKINKDSTLNTSPYYPMSTPELQTVQRTDITEPHQPRQIIPPPPMFSNLPTRSENQMAMVNKSILPPSVARRIQSNQPVVKSSPAPPLTYDANIFVPQLPSEFQSENKSSDNSSIISSTQSAYVLPTQRTACAVPEEYVNTSAVSVQFSQNVPTLNTINMQPDTAIKTEDTVVTPLPMHVPQIPLQATNQPPFEPPKAVPEPPKHIANQNFRLTKKRPQYYSGPIEGVGAMFNSTKPVIPAVHESTSFGGTLFVPNQITPTPDRGNFAVDFTSSVSMDDTNQQSFPASNPNTQFQIPNPQLESFTAFDLSRSSTDYSDTAENKPTGMGLIGSLKSKLNSIDINKIQNTVTTFFDPAYNITNQDSKNLQNFENPNQQHSHQRFSPTVDGSYPMAGHTQPSYQFIPHHQFQQSVHTDYQNFPNTTYDYSASYGSNCPQASKPLNTDNESMQYTQNSFYTSYYQPMQPDLQSQLNTGYDSGVTFSTSENTSAPHGSEIATQTLIPKEDEHDNSVNTPFLSSADNKLPVSTASIHNEDNFKHSDSSYFHQPNAETKKPGEETVSKLSLTSMDGVNTVLKFKQGSFDIKPKNDSVSNFTYEDMLNSSQDYSTNVPLSAYFSSSTTNESNNSPLVSSFGKNMDDLSLGYVENKPITTMPLTPIVGADSAYDHNEALNDTATIISALGKNLDSLNLEYAKHESSDEMPHVAEEHGDNVRLIGTSISPDVKDTSTIINALGKNLDNLNIEYAQHETIDTMRRMADTSALKENDESSTIKSALNKKLDDLNLDHEQHESIGTTPQDTTKENVPIMPLVISSTTDETNEPSKIISALGKNLDNLSLEYVQHESNIPVPHTIGENVPDKEEACNMESMFCQMTTDYLDQPYEYKVPKAPKPEKSENRELHCENHDSELVSELNFCETCREFTKPGDKVRADDTMKVIDYITSPAQLVNPLEVASHNTEYDGSNLFVQADSLFSADSSILQTATEILPQMKVPTAPPVEEDSSGIDVQLIEQDAKEDFPIYEEYVIEPSENDDDIIEYKPKEVPSEDTVQNVDTFTSRVEKYKTLEENYEGSHNAEDDSSVDTGVFAETDTDIASHVNLDAEPLRLYQFYPTDTTTAVTLTSYFDTGNYAAETHYRNSLSSTSPPHVASVFDNIPIMTPCANDNVEEVATKISSGHVIQSNTSAHAHHSYPSSIRMQLMENSDEITVNEDYRNDVNEAIDQSHVGRTVESFFDKTELPYDDFASQRTLPDHMQYFSSSLQANVASQNSSTISELHKNVAEPEPFFDKTELPYDDFASQKALPDHMQYFSSSFQANATSQKTNTISDLHRNVAEPFNLYSQLLSKDIGDHDYAANTERAPIETEKVEFKNDEASLQTYIDRARAEPTIRSDVSNLSNSVDATRLAHSFATNVHRDSPETSKVAPISVNKYSHTERNAEEPVNILNKPKMQQASASQTLPDHINFFSANLQTSETSQPRNADSSAAFSRLASYFTTPPMNDDSSKSFFELSQGQDHLRHSITDHLGVRSNVPSSNFSISPNIQTNSEQALAKSFFQLSQSENHYKENSATVSNERYLANLELMNDLTSYQNFSPSEDSVVKTVNYFDVILDNKFNFNIADKTNSIAQKDKIKIETKLEAEPSVSEETSLEIDGYLHSVIKNCVHCYNVACNKMTLTDPVGNLDLNNCKLRKAMDPEGESSGKKETSEQENNESDDSQKINLKVNFDNSISDLHGQLTCTDDNRTSSEYSPVNHHWFYRYDYEGKSIWRGFSMGDSKSLEEAYNSPDLNEHTLVPTDGGRYDVNVMGRLRISVYWTDKPTNVRRCSWFYKGNTDARYVPYTEPVAEKLEEEYRHGITTGVWHRKLVLPNNESVVMHGPSMMVHFLHTSNSEWGNSTLFGKRVYRNPPRIRVPQDQNEKIDHLLLLVHGAGEWRHQKRKIESTSRPRVVRRGYDDLDIVEIEDSEPSNIDHLLLLCHGVGSACDMRFRSVEEVVDDFRASSLQLGQSHYRNSYESGAIGRVEMLPISWHSTLHSGETGVDRRLAQITLESIPKLRNFTNDTVLDVLFYTSPVYCQTIINTVCRELNRIYTLFKSRNPSFTGGVSLGGHSLGSVILYDLLTHQIADTHSKSDFSIKSFVQGSAETGQSAIRYPRLDFKPDALYALGSPIAIFECIRGVELLGNEFKLPTCPAFFNIFHPYDPIAYRIEPLLNPDLKKIPPYQIPHHKGRKRMHLELKDTMARVGSDIKHKLIESIKATWFSVWRSQPPSTEKLEKVVEEQLQKETSIPVAKEEALPNIDLSTSKKMGRLNGGRRVDYVLQEAPFETINEYLSAATSHLCYWESEDTMLLMLREIYSSLGVQPDSTVPQHTMTMQRTRVLAYGGDDLDSDSVDSVDAPSTSHNKL